MNREQKELVVKGLKDNFSKSQAAFLVSCKGLTVNDFQSLRKELRSNGAVLKVAKDRLVKRALDGIAGMEDLRPFLKDQLAVVFADKDATTVAKTLRDFGKKVEIFSVVAGYAESQLIDKNTFNVLASIPSREVLLAQLCGLLKSPMTKLALTVKVLADQKGAASKQPEAEQ